MPYHEFWNRARIHMAGPVRMEMSCDDDDVMTPMICLFQTGH